MLELAYEALMVAGLGFSLLVRLRIINMIEATKENGQAPSQNLSATAKLRFLIDRPGQILVCPGVYDGFTARIALQAGFDCLYMV